jgi:predicted enzyme related to lactoylglutathione lyase
VTRVVRARRSAGAYDPGMQKNTISHFEIYANDPEKLAKFYTDMFDWTITPVPGMDYRTVHTGDTDARGMLAQPGAINGGIAKRPEGYQVNGFVNYAMVDSIEDAVAKATSLGAKVTKGKTAVPGMGWFAMFLDPEGNNFAVFKADSQATP